MDRVEEIAKSPKNLEKKEACGKTPETVRRTIGGGMPERREKLPRTPITAEPESDPVGELLGFRYVRLLLRPDGLTSRSSSSNRRIYRHEHFDEDTVVGNEIPILARRITLRVEPFRCADCSHAKSSYPWIARDPVIRGSRPCKTGYLRLPHIGPHAAC